MKSPNQADSQVAPETTWYIGHPCSEINTRELQKPETLRSKSRNLKHVPFWSGLEINSSAGQHGAVPRTCTNSKKSLLYRICEEGKGNWLQCVLNYMTWATLFLSRTGGPPGFQAQCLLRGEMLPPKAHIHNEGREMTDTLSTWAKAWPLHLCEEPYQDTGGTTHTLPSSGLCPALAQTPLAQGSVLSVILWKSLMNYRRNMPHYVWVQPPPHTWLWPLGDMASYNTACRSKDDVEQRMPDLGKRIRQL